MVPGDTSTKTTDPIVVTLPNGNKMYSHHKTTLQLPHVEAKAVEAHIFPTMTEHSLISVGQLCDAGCLATFDSDSVLVTHNDKTVLKGQRDDATKLWTVPIITDHSQKAPQTALNVNFSTKVNDLVAFAHGAMFSPALSTLQRALRHNFITIPGLNLENLKLHPPPIIATTKGHLDQVRKNKQSTALQAIEEDEPFPTQQTTTNICYTSCLPQPVTGKMYSDQTGRFPIPSRSGNNYMFVLYDYDSNSIHAEPIPNRESQTILKAYKCVLDKLNRAGLHPKLHHLDNECSSALKEFFVDNHIDYQLAPPGMHRANAAERAIRTLKNHFIAGLCTAHPDFPLNLWDQLLPQAILTLNHLRGSRINPNLSAWAQVYGLADFNRTPIGPPGHHLLIHDKPLNRKSWDPHALDAWYLGPALDHYRCYRVFPWKTRHERIVDTVTWVPHTLKLPMLSSKDVIIDCATQIIAALQHPVPHAEALRLTNPQHQALVEMAQIMLPPLPPQFPVPPATPVPTFQPRDNLDDGVQFNHVAPQRENRTIMNNKSNIEQRQSQRKPCPTAKFKSWKLGHQANAAASNPNINYHPFTLLLTQGQQSALGAINATPTDTSILWVTETDLAPLLRVEQTDQMTLSPVTLNQPPQAAAEFPQAYALSAINCDTGQLAEYRQLLASSEGHLWEQAGTKEFARLCNGCPAAGVSENEGTNTMTFIHVKDLPTNRKATYARIVVADRPSKADSKRMRLTVGGDRIDYPDEVSTKTSSLPTAKILINSTISTPNARAMVLDIKDFYLNTPMERTEYMRININDIPTPIISHYQILALAHKGHVYVAINKGMYGLPQAGRLANDQLIKHLNKHGYKQSKFTPGLFTHQTLPIAFCLVVDDFFVKYVGNDNANHIITTLKHKYTITIDRTATQYLGLSLLWTFGNTPSVTISMPGYVEKALQRFQHPTPQRSQHSPHPWLKPQYGAKTQFTAKPDNSHKLPADEVTRLQQIIGVFLYYARAVDSTMLVALGTLAAAQTQATTNTTKLVTQFLDYAATHPDASVCYFPSEMILHIHSDASYLSEPGARSRAGGLFFLGNNLLKSSAPISPVINGAIHINSQIMKNVLASAAEAEVAACFLNAQDACMLRTTLTDLGHQQPPTPIQTDNQCAQGILNDTVKQKRSKAIDMRFYWLKDRICQKQFHVHWAPGLTNMADYFTKHHSPAHHQTIRPTYHPSTS
jgi:hypothetical protein